ncbi:KR domain [Musa troglodytarum]|uniref:KR domain n=1 Tax=Musa troglodytarum TaxID=320322 RepID=A0A9E7K307_9LILI|nr:KR domain [Musa troglodytarum]
MTLWGRPLLVSGPAKEVPLFAVGALVCEGEDGAAGISRGRGEGGLMHAEAVRVHGGRSKRDSVTGSMSYTNRIALVTGANKGIGLEICRQLLCKGIRVILTARDEQRGLAAVADLQASGASDSDVLFHQLDVADSASVASLADFVRDQFGKLDVLVNNAAVSGLALCPEIVSSFKQVRGRLTLTDYANSITETYDMVEECLNINYYGTKTVTEALIPLLRSSQSPRIVNLSSFYGRLRYIPGDRIKEEMRNVDVLSEDRLNELLQSFLNDFKERKLEENGWPTSICAYKVSKVAVSAYTRILAKKNPNICINCVHPGLVKTDMNWNTGELPVEEGAQGPVFVALLPDGSPSGQFYDMKEVSSFE